MLRFFLSCLFCSLSAAAQTTHYSVGTFDGSMKIVTDRTMVNELNHEVESVRVVKNGKVFFEHSAVVFWQALIEAVLIAPENGNGPYLLTVWTSGGANTYNISVFDLSLGLQGYDATVYSDVSRGITVAPSIDELEVGTWDRDYNTTSKWGWDIIKTNTLCRWETREIEDEFKLACDEPDAVSEKIGS